MSRPNPNQFVVRALQGSEELRLCAALDHSFMTDNVWQMDLRTEADDDLTIRFRTVRLPRSVTADYPYTPADLLTQWQSLPRMILVAAVETVILGYVQVSGEDNHSHGFIHHLVVDRPMRRHRIGSALLDQAQRWARLHGLRHLTLAIQTKNYPAISFARKKGFVFCGFNDHYYPNQDIAVLFGKSI